MISLSIEQLTMDVFTGRQLYISSERDIYFSC